MTSNACTNRAQATHRIRAHRIPMRANCHYIWPIHPLAKVASANTGISPHRYLPPPSQSYADIARALLLTPHRSPVVVLLLRNIASAPRSSDSASNYKKRKLANILAHNTARASRRRIFKCTSWRRYPKRTVSVRKYTGNYPDSHKQRLALKPHHNQPQVKNNPCRPRRDRASHPHANIDRRTRYRTHRLQRFNTTQAVKHSLRAMSTNKGAYDQLVIAF
jgi:hypothetical protein